MIGIPFPCVSELSSAAPKPDAPVRASWDCVCRFFPFDSPPPGVMMEVIGYDGLLALADMNVPYSLFAPSASSLRLPA